jgi:hypothetical protein
MKCSASLSLAISSHRRQDARANFMNEHYHKRCTPWFSRQCERLVSGKKLELPSIIFLSGISNSMDINHSLGDAKWRGYDRNDWQGVSPFYLSLL